MIRLTLTFRAERGDAARLARRGADRRADRPRQPPRADPRARRACSPDADAESPARARALRPRRLQALQRHLRPPGRRRPARPPRRATWQAFLDGRGRRLPDGRRRVLRAVRAARRGRRPVVEGAALALSEHGEGFWSAAPTARSCCPPRRTDAAEALRIADQRMYAQKHAGRDVGRPPDQGRAAARAGRARPGARRPRRAPSPSSPRPPPAGSASTATSARRVRHAAELHDVGKVAIPDASSQARPADEEEWASSAATRPASASSPPRRARAASPPLVRASHERWDGTGYPDRLAGEEIPLGARIVAVADAFDAMTAERPYRAARPPSTRDGVTRSRRGRAAESATSIPPWSRRWRRAGLA